MIEAKIAGVMGVVVLLAQTLLVPGVQLGLTVLALALAIFAVYRANQALDAVAPKIDEAKKVGSAGLREASDDP